MVVKKGFTLIELLVVIAIIAMLLGFLIPSLNAVKERTCQVVCMAHLKNIGYGMQAYAMDNGEKFPDSYTLGGFSFRATPGYKNPDDPMGLPEKFGLSAVLDNYNCVDSGSNIWICSGQPHRWMREIGNTYAFSIARMLFDTKTVNMKRYSKTWLLWDNYTLKPYTPGVRAYGGEPGYSIPLDQRKFPHSFANRKNKGINVMYADGHSAPHIEQN